MTQVEEIAEAGAFVAVLGVGRVALGRERLQRRRREMRARARARKVEAAATQAGLEVAAFAPEAIRSAVDEILSSAVDGGASRDKRDWAHEVTVQGWAASHDLREPMHLARRARVDLLGLVNTRGKALDRVIVRVRAAVVIGEVERRRQVKIDDRWSLGRRGKVWRLVEFDSTPLADAVLDAPVTW